MPGASPTSPDQILAQGAARGIAVEAFGPIWDTARLKFGRVSWANAGLEPFLTYDVPYTGTSSGRLSEDAVHVFLSTARSSGPLRILELGAGSGVFAKLFLDYLLDLAPDVYARTSYLVTDGSVSVLTAQAAHGVLDKHADRVETRVLDAASDQLGEAEFDAILGTYILDSLPFDLLAVNDRRIWRKEGRSVVEDTDAPDAAALRAALDDGSAEELAKWAWIAPRLGLQTRHVSIERAQLQFGDSLPRDTDGQTVPFVHCHGALGCLNACCKALRDGGVAIFSDYGHLAILPRYEFLEFQAYGASIAVGVNFLQMSATAEGWSDTVLYKPEDEEGNIYTRVMQKARLPDRTLQHLVEARYGAATYRAQNDPLDKARTMLKSRHYEGARTQYREALASQPGNWAIMEEVASTFLMMTADHTAAIEMTDQGLTQNPYAPGLWRTRFEALLALDRHEDARVAVEHLVELAPTLPSTWRVLAELEYSENNYCAALDAVAMGLKHDKSCDEQDVLLQVQNKVLAAIALREHQSLVASVNQMRAIDRLPE